jgi:hypothetical protein
MSCYSPATDREIEARIEKGDDHALFIKGVRLHEGIKVFYDPHTREIIETRPNASLADQTGGFDLIMQAARRGVAVAEAWLKGNNGQSESQTAEPQVAGSPHESGHTAAPVPQANI